MSRIGRLPIDIPAKVKVEVQGRKVFVEGPKGKLFKGLRSDIADLPRLIATLPEIETPFTTRRCLYSLTRPSVASKGSP